MIDVDGTTRAEIMVVRAVTLGLVRQTDVAITGGTYDERKKQVNADDPAIFLCVV